MYMYYMYMSCMYDQHFSPFIFRPFATYRCLFGVSREDAFLNDDNEI